MFAIIILIDNYSECFKMLSDSLLDMSMSKYAEELANINFTNPEDIFDFSARPSTHYSAPVDYSKLHHKLIAEPSVKLSDLLSMANRETEYQQIKIHCTNCRSGFIYPDQQTDSCAGEKLYYCTNCKTCFFRQTDPTPADHVPYDQEAKITIVSNPIYSSFQLVNHMYSFSTVTSLQQLLAQLYDNQMVYHKQMALQQS